MHTLMVHFAEIDPETQLVKRVIVAESKEWCETQLGGTWARTYYSTPGHTYAGIGYEYIDGNFRPPQPYPSWTFDFNTWQWVPPIPYPDDDDGRPRHWHEESHRWVLLI